MAPMDEEDYHDEVEERLVNEEYKIWKKNTPFLYGAPPLLPLRGRDPSSSPRPALRLLPAAPRPPAADTWRRGGGHQTWSSRTRWSGPR